MTKYIQNPKIKRVQIYLNGRAENLRGLLEGYDFKAKINHRGKF